jgi:uncharacterized Zn finger protein (UPF0148 family)
MSESLTERVIAEEVEEGTPSRARLLTIDDVRVEMAKIYREARAKKLPVGDASRLMFMLGQLGRVTEVATIERRLDELQAALKKAGINYVPKH